MSDMNFKVNLGLDYNKDSVFEENKEIELLQKKADFISSIMGSIVETDDEGNEKPYFDLEFLVREYLGLTDEKLALNQRYKDEKKLKKEGYKQEDIAKFGMPSTVTASMFDGEDAYYIEGVSKSNFNTEKSDFKMNFTAYAIQAAEIADIDAAYTALFN